MKHNLRLIIFVGIMGLITSFLLAGMDALTKERILANQEAELKTTIMKAYDISYTLANLHEVFDESVKIMTHDGLSFYIDESTGYVSYVFEGSGVWGPIIGVITLQSDFETIASIVVLQQEETPGLGGIVAEAKYLSNFNGIKMVPSLEINKDARGAPNEVNAISGATRTSKAFEELLNESYARHKAAWLILNG